MPYKVEGKKVLHYKNGKWSIKQTCGSHEKAEKALTLLNMKEAGVKPKGGWRK